MIEGHELFLNLTEHFRRWAAHLGRFGLLVLDLHTVDAEQAARQLGRTLATPYDATHGYSDQYPIELSEFLDAARAAGPRASRSMRSSTRPRPWRPSASTC